MLTTDRQGNAMTGATHEASDLFCDAVSAFNLYRGDPVGLIDEALRLAPDFVMAHVFRAYLFALATEPDLTEAARAQLTQVRTMRCDEREVSHIKALDHIVSGEWTEAAQALDLHNARYPRDIIGLQAGHLVDFYRAHARSLRDRVARVLPHWTPSDPGYSSLLGMYAFGLEESGDYARAEDAGRAAVDREPLECWAHHAVAHVMEMQGRSQDGIGWMIAREPYWSGDDNFFKVHNWWHRALFHLDLGQTREAFALYDGPIRENRSGVVLDLVDASALLWRLTLMGHDVGDRWTEVAQAWDKHADGGSYPFNDWHAVMAYLGAGREADTARIIGAFRSGGRGSEANEWGQRTGLALAEGFAAFWRGAYTEAAGRLWRARHIANSFGGSHAQRDIIDWTLMEALLRGGLTEMAESLANERVAFKPHSPINRSFLVRAKSDDAPDRRAA